MPALPLPPEANLGIAAKRVVAYWDYMDGIPEDDPRPTEQFKAEMDARMSWLRWEIERDDERRLATERPSVWQQIVMSLRRRRSSSEGK